jgi:hypothetical protein
MIEHIRPEFTPGKLRNTGCPENLSMEILGHAQGSVAANYGSGYAIDVMREALVKVWGE